MNGKLTGKYDKQALGDELAAWYNALTPEQQAAYDKKLDEVILAYSRAEFSQMQSMLDIVFGQKQKNPPIL